MTTAPDLIVVGGGPAGLAAAATALAGGLRVVLVDAGHALGGQYWRHPPVAPERVADLHHDLGTYAALTANLGRAVRREPEGLSSGARWLALSLRLSR